jgi:hypothetical protein
VPPPVPAEPTAEVVHVPGVALQVWQALPHAALQQNPSTQWPLTHSPQAPGWEQSVARLQVWPFAFTCWQDPPAAQ